MLNKNDFVLLIDPSLRYMIPQMTYFIENLYPEIDRKVREKSFEGEYLPELHVFTYSLSSSGLIGSICGEEIRRN